MASEDGHMNLRHLLGVVAVADSGTLSEAAVRINLSQPALTQGLAGIERTLGVALFHRKGGGMQLTEPGSIFVARLRRGAEFLRRAAVSAGRPSLQHVVSAGQLRGLIAAVEHGGFRPAAAALNRQVSTISRACRDVESQAGVTLFEPTSSGLQPTRQAEDLARFAKLAFVEFQQAKFDVRGWLGAFEGRLAVGCLPLAQPRILPDALIRFSEEFPSISPRVVDGYYASLARALRRGDLDVLVGALRKNDLPEGITQIHMFSDPLCVVARAGHPLDGRRDIGPEALGSFPWVLPRLGAPSRAYMEVLQRKMSIPEGVPRPIETGAHSVMRGVLFGSDRLALISESQIVRDVAHGVLVRLDVDLEDSRRDIGVAHRSDWLPGLPQARFLEILRAGFDALG